MSKSYVDMNGPELLNALGDSARLWARAFCQINASIFPDNPLFKDPSLDFEGTMIGWFANAIEHSHDIRTARPNVPDSVN